jgi:hypothetical protein
MNSYIHTYIRMIHTYAPTYTHACHRPLERKGREACRGHNKNRGREGEKERKRETGRGRGRWEEGGRESGREGGREGEREPQDVGEFKKNRNEISLTLETGAATELQQSSSRAATAATE